MGLILDSSVVIAGERRGRVWSSTHGIERAGTEERRQRRQAFVDELIRDVPVHPVVIETARLAGSIEGSQAAQGVTIAFEDLLIAATALQTRLRRRHRQPPSL